MRIIGKINPQLYKCITPDITSTNVIITDNQIQHIQDRHPNDYERFSFFLQEIIADPEFIIETQKPFTALILKSFPSGNLFFKTVLRLATIHDNPNYNNSVITFMKIDEKEFNRLIKNKKILYKKF